VRKSKKANLKVGVQGHLLPVTEGEKKRNRRGLVPRGDMRRKEERKARRSGGSQHDKGTHQKNASFFGKRRIEQKGREEGGRCCDSKRE